MTMRRIFLIFSAGLLLQNCYYPPKPVIRLDAGPEAVWNSGRQILYTSDSLFTIALMYQGEQSDRYRFHIEIDNHSDQTVLITPEKFFYTIFNEKIETISAIDPEREILNLERKYSRDQASYQSRQGSHSLIMLLGLVTTVASVGQERTEEEDEEMREINENLYDTYLENEQEFNRDKDQFINGLWFWEEQALRRTTLPPGTAISGSIHFPLKLRQSVPKIQFHICFEGKIYSFDFSQRIYQSANLGY